MADQLGIKRCWYHKDHYDIPKRRIEEIEALCQIVTPQDIVRIIGRKKKLTTGEILAEAKKQHEYLQI
jgi:hypothetical protein